MVKWHLVIRGMQSNGHLAYRGLTVRTRSRVRAALAGYLIAQRWGWTRIESVETFKSTASKEVK